MSIDYLTRDDIEAHEAAMQQVLEEKKRKQEVIDDEKEIAIDAAHRSIRAAEDEADQELATSEKEIDSQLAAMQRDFERLPLLRQVYHEAPDDVFELLVSKCSDVADNGWGFPSGSKAMSSSHAQPLL